MFVQNAIDFDGMKKETNQHDYASYYGLVHMTARTHLHPLLHYCSLQILHLEINQVEFASGEL